MPNRQDRNFCYSEYCEMSQNFCHSGSLEKYYKLANSYFSKLPESVNTDEKPIKLDRFRISGTRIKRISASPYILCSCLSGMTIVTFTTDKICQSAILHGGFSRHKTHPLLILCKKNRYQKKKFHYIHMDVRLRLFHRLSL